MERCLLRAAATETDGQQDRLIAIHRQFRGQRDVAVGGAVILFGELAVGVQDLPAVGHADEADRSGNERPARGQREP